METPKLLWLAEHMPDTFANAWQFFDLTDFLTWRATGSLARSVCTVTCKWTYLAHENRWDEGYFREIGLGALADEAFRRIGTEVVPGRYPARRGLDRGRPRPSLGLAPGTPVAAGLSMPMPAASARSARAAGRQRPFAHGLCFRHLGLHHGVDPGSAFVEGVWGPYFSAMVPGLWLNEGGQSAAGAAIDHLVRLHPAAEQAARTRRSMA